MKSLLTKKIRCVPLALLIVAGCTYKEAPVPENEKAKNIQLDAQPDPAKVTVQELKSFDVDKIQSQVDSTQDASTLEKDLAQLSQFVLNPKFTQDPETSTSDQLRSMLTVYNAALLKLQQAQPDSPSVQKILDQYQAAATYGCDVNLKGCTQTFAYFRSDYNTAQILQLAVKRIGQQIDSSKVDIGDKVKQCQSECQGKVALYYRLLQWTLAMRNTIRAPDIDFLYLQHAWDYADYLRTLPASARKQQIFRQHGAIFEKILADFPRQWGNSEFSEFVTSANVFQYSLLQPDPFPFGRNDLFAMAASHYLYTTPEQPHQLSPKVIEAIKLSQAEDDPLGPSFSQILAKLKTEQPLIFKTLKLDVSKLNDSLIMSEYFLMVDRLYRGHWDREKVTQVWLGSDRDANKLLSTIDYYLKVQVLELLVETNRYMSDIYAGKDFSPATLITEILQKSGPISQKWIDMLDRSQKLLSFMDTQLNHPGDAGYQSYQDTKTMINGLSRNIKFLSVYPNMALLVYFIADTNAHLTVDTWFGPVEINSDLIINAFFDGKLPPWFRFGKPTDDSALGRFDLIYAFYFALNTGTFETFGSKTDSRGKPLVDRQMFFQKVMNQYMSTEVNDLRTALTNLKQNRQASASYDNFIQVCKKEMQSSPDHDNYSIQVDFDNIQHFAFAGNGKFGLTSTAQDVYSSFYAPGNVGPHIRIDLDKKLLLIRSMVSMLSENLETLKKSGVAVDAQSAQILADINSKLQDIENLKRAYYDEAYSEHRAVSDCLTRMETIEDQHQKILYHMEMDHLRQVYRAMVSIQNLSGDALNAETDRLNKQFKFSPGLDSITKDKYFYTKVDLMLRMKDRMENQLKPAVQINMPPDLKKLDYYGKPVALSLFSADTHQQLTEDEFVANGMRLLNGHDRAYISWATDTTSIAPRFDKIFCLVQLYKLGFSLNLPANLRVSADEIINESLRMAQFINISSDDLELLNWLGLDRKVPREEVVKFLFKGSEEKGILDTAFDYMADNQDVLGEATEFYKAGELLLHFLFAPDPQVKQLLRQTYRPLVTSVENMGNDFSQHILEPSADVKALIQGFASSALPYEIVRNGAKADFNYYTIANDSSGAPTILDPRKIWQFTATMTTFHSEDTQDYFRPHKGDPECEATNRPSTCDTPIPGTEIPL